MLAMVISSQCQNTETSMKHIFQHSEGKSPLLEEDLRERLRLILITTTETTWFKEWRLLHNPIS